MMISGLAFALGTISPYIVSYFRINLRYDVNYDTFYPLQAITEIICSAIYPLANFLVMKKFHERSRPALLIGAFSGISLLYLCVAIKVHPHVFILMYAAGCGFLKGFFKQCSLIAGWSHLGGRKGLVSGIILGGYGVGGSIYGLYYHMNIVRLNEEPIEDKKDHNLYFPKEVGARYPTVHKEVMMVVFIISMVAIAIITNFSAPVSPIRGL